MERGNLLGKRWCTLFNLEVFYLLQVKKLGWHIDIALHHLKLWEHVPSSSASHRRAKPAGAKGRKCKFDSSSPVTLQPVQDSIGLLPVFKMCCYLGPYGSNHPLLMWKLTRIGRVVMSEVCLNLVKLVCQFSFEVICRKTSWLHPVCFCFFFPYLFGPLTYFPPVMDHLCNMITFICY